MCSRFRAAYPLVLLCASVLLIGCGGGSSPSSSSSPVVAPTTTSVAPTITSVSPSSVAAGAPALTLTITGSGFQNSTSVQVGGTVVSTVFVSNIQLTATVPASVLVNGVNLPIVAANGTASSSGATAVALEVDNPAPVLSSVVPGGVSVGAPGVVGTVTGTGFVPSTVINVNGAARPTTYVSASQVGVAFNTADFASTGRLSLTAVNPSPGGGSSLTLVFPVANPAPGAITLVPASVNARSAAPTAITVTGSNFVDGTVVQINGATRATTVVSSSQLTFTLGSADQAQAGTLAVTVATPAPGGGISGPATLTVANPLPSASALSPATLAAGGSVAAAISVNGANFEDTTVAQVNGVARQTSVVSGSQLTFQLTVADQASAGSLPITLFTPGPGGGTSQALALTLQRPTPTMTAISPTTANLGGDALTVTATGTAFRSTSVVFLGTEALPTVLVSEHLLQFTVPAASLASSGTVSVTIHDAGPPSVVSNALTFTVTNTAPKLTSYTPAAIPVYSADTSATLLGTGFNQTSVVLLGSTPLQTTLVSATQLAAVIPAANLTATGQIVLSVSNPAPGGGMSGSAIISVTAAIVSLSPASVPVHSTAPVVTITGYSFTPTSVVYLSGSRVVPTFVSSQTLQFTVPPFFLGGPYPISVWVSDPASQNLDSNRVSLPVVYPGPVLTALSSANVTAGSPGFILTLTGSGLLSSSTVLINGVSQSSSVSGTTLSTTLTAAQLSSVGQLAVTVVNPTPGGGTSNALVLNVLPSSNRIRTVNAAASALGWDAAHGLVLAATTSTSSHDPNSLIAMDPLGGSIVATQTLPVQADDLAVSGDGAYVYVSLPTTGQVERLLLPSLTPDLTFSLGTASNGQPYRAESLSVAPGHPHTITLSRHVQGTVLGANGGVVVYDDGVARTNIAYPTNGANDNYDALVWGSDDTTLYATNDSISGGTEYAFAVSPTGVTLTSSQGGILSSFVQQLFFDASTSRLFDGYGAAVNAVTQQSTGSLPPQNTLSYGALPFTIDTAQRKAFYLNVNDSSSNSSYGTAVQAFDIDRYAYLNTLRIPGLSGGGRIVRWGTSGLAVNGPSQIFLVDGSFVSPAGTTSPVGTYGTPSPTLASITPAAVPAGSPDTLLTLRGTDFSLASVVTWNNQVLPVDAASDTQVTLTLPASLLAKAAAGAVTVTNGPGTTASGPLGFTVLPDLGPGASLTALDLAGQDAAWDATHNLLYVAVPAVDAAAPNSVATVDPARSSVQSILAVLNQPSTLSASSDGSYLYVGYSGNAVVQRFALPDLSLDLTIPLGSGLSKAGPIGGRQSCTFAVTLAAAPNSPRTVAVDQGSAAVSPRGCGGLTIFDDAILRRNVLPYTTGGDLTTFTWGADASALFGQTDVAIQPQSLLKLGVDSNGVTPKSVLRNGSFGARVHFDAGTGLLYSDSGTITNSAGVAVGNVNTTSGSFAEVLLPDSAANRLYFLSTSLSSAIGSQSSSFTLQIFDLRSLTLLNTITLPALLGTPTRMVRWGTNGLAITTIGLTTVSNGGMLYLLQGSAITGP